jgi:hypothetical protein
MHNFGQNRLLRRNAPYDWHQQSKHLRPKQKESTHNDERKQSSQHKKFYWSWWNSYVQYLGKTPTCGSKESIVKCNRVKKTYLVRVWLARVHECWRIKRLWIQSKLFWQLVWRQTKRLRGVGIRFSGHRALISGKYWPKECWCYRNWD